MSLVLTLENNKQNSLLIRVAMAIALQCYRDLQSSYGFMLRNENILDIKRVMELSSIFKNTKDGELIDLDLKDMLLLVTVFDITLKALTSDDPYRFIHAAEDDETKRAQIREELIGICSEMTIELSEQAMYRYEVQQHRQYLSQFEY